MNYPIDQSGETGAHPASQDRAGHEPSQSSLSRPVGDHPIARFTPGPWKARDGFWIEAPKRFIATIDGGPSAQTTANAHLITAAPELYAALERAVAFLRAAPLESGVCCCGSPIEGHGLWDGHSPVDELQYHAGGLADQFAEVLAKARGQ